MGIHLLLQLHIWSSTGYSTRTAVFLVYINDLPSRLPLQYAFLLMSVCCTELFENRRMQNHYKQISIIYRSGKQSGRWYLTRTSANISGSTTSEISYRFHIYNIPGQTFKETLKAKYLGVTIDSKLSWNSYNDALIKRANQTIAFLCRNLSICPKDVKANATSP